MKEEIISVLSLKRYLSQHQMSEGMTDDGYIYISFNRGYNRGKKEQKKINTCKEEQ